MYTSTLIHFPGWILLNQFVYPDIIGNIGFVFIVGIMMGYVLRKTGSLWACILIHSFINFASLSIVQQQIPFPV
jgi:membrane protease YdiL (CAAX protease family)